MSRSYHNLTARYNILFNGSESIKKGQLQIAKSYKDDYLEVLPVFYYEDKSVNDGATSDMDRSIKKAEKLIAMHSITAKPEIKKNKTLSPAQREFQSKREYNKWVDENYLMMGKAYFHKHDFEKAKEIFLFITNEYKEEKTANESRIWLIRTYNETNKFESSEELIKILEAEMKLSKRLKTELYSSIADFYIKQNNFESAIPYLERAQKQVKSKRLRVRYMFILAQLYEKTGNSKKASDAYGDVISMNPPYEMTFHAKINRALAYEKGFGSVKEIENQLYKMLKDDKNKDYQDQIYFALGNIALKNGNKNLALERHKKGVEKNTGNSDQKTISFLTIADIYYGIPDYVNAQTYYDSAVNLIDMSYPNYDVLYSKSKHLTSLVEEINTLQLEDSVQRLAKMPNPELLAYIDKIIENERKREEEKRAMEQERMLDEQFDREMAFNNPVNTSTIGGSGGWYFYNETAKNIGYKEFKAKFGNRKLEDNWRRRNKSSSMYADESMGETDLITDEEVTKVGITNKNSKEYYLQNIPLNDSMMNASHKKIESALFSMGLIYKNDLKDNHKAIDSFKELIARYPSSEYILKAYYNLYSIYKLDNNTAMSELYKDKIVSQFPESAYARLLSDPNYLKNLEEEDNKVVKYYSVTYDTYQNGNYSEVISRCGYAFENFPNDKLIPQFAYLRSLSIGRTQDAKTFRDNLYEIVSKYPATEVAENAKNIIAYLDKEKPAIKEEAEKEIAKKLYENDSLGIHYFVFSVPKQIQTNQLTFNIINFNLDNYDELNLKAETAELNNNRKLIVIKPFADKSSVMPYFNKIDQSDVFKDVNPAGIVSFVISEKNYQVLQTDKSVDRYLKFFGENYR